MFLVTWATFIAAAAISFAIQARSVRHDVSFAGFLRHAFPLTAWRQGTARIDIVMYVLSKLIDRIPGFSIVSSVFGAGLIAHLLALAFPDHVVIQPGIAIIAACAVVAFLTVDFANYLSHYMQHFVPVLWELHKVHHSATFLNPLTTKRMHPLGDAFDAVVAGLLVSFPIGIAAFLFGLTIPDMAMLAGIANTIGTILVLDSLRHSHFPVSFGSLDKVILSPHMHQLHHSCRIDHWDKNFGNKLSVFDWLFGTAYLPARDEHIPLGLGKPEEAEYNNVTGAYLGPLQKIVRLLGQKLRPAPDRPTRATSFAEGILWRDEAEKRLLAQKTHGLKGPRAQGGVWDKPILTADAGPTDQAV
jgi:sterol desaturase/sphingolipid hydroxylase (fatty acid hydroxylase superfamily)